MFYENELQFLCSIFKKSNIRTLLTVPSDPASKVLDHNIETFFGVSPKDAPIHAVFGNISPNTIYKFTDSFEISYTYLALPQTQNETILFIGPYVSERFSARHILEIGERNGIAPKDQKMLNECYEGIPILTEGNPLFVALDTFCEKAFGTATFSIIDIDRERRSPASPLKTQAEGADTSDDVFIKMKNMEQRYDFENDLMDAVSLGQIHKASLLASALSEKSFEKRVADPLRNMKNYSIIMNTLFRKAAQKGGVHPMYLDRISSEFALKIEQMQSVTNSSELMKDMLPSYCRLVRKHSMKDYSPIVQKAIILIDSDLSADLALSSLAADQNVSPGYLSTIFKRETSKTITEYIREKRMNHAAHLLATTHLQIQTIALHCGIMDVQYFSKTFKKHTGKTPKEYRASVKQ